MTNYVKFLKGTPSAFSGLQSKDKDTLYFITAENASYGKLYLGDVLVAGSVTPDGTSIIDSLGELIDVNLSGLRTGQVLSYNGSEWVPMTLSEAIMGSVMTGATETTAGAAGLVPAPAAGDQDKFLRGDGKWVAVSGGSDLSNYVTKEDFSEATQKIEQLEETQTETQKNMTWGQLI